MKKQATAMSSFELPHDQKVEEIVLGMLLLEATAINEVDELLTPEVFYYPANQLIYKAIETLHRAGKPLDMMVVATELMKDGRIDEVGGPIYVCQLASLVASTSTLGSHARYLHQLYVSRRLLTVTQQIQAKALNHSLDIEDTLTEALSMLEGVITQTQSNVNTVDLRDVLLKSMDEYYLRSESVKKGRKMGVLTGIHRLDIALAGLRPQQLVIIAARPSMGKTAFALHVARMASLKGNAVAFFSLEMSSVSLSDRMIIASGNLDSELYRQGVLSQAEEHNMEAAAGELQPLPITIDDEGGLSIQQIKNRAKNLKRKGKCDLIIIDYLQLIDVRTGNKSYNREQEVSQCSKEAKQLAKQLDVPVVLLSQLSRECEKRADKTPILSDLRESGSIEQDADVVLMLHRPEYYDKSKPQGEGIIRVAKNRDGRTGDVDFRYNRSMTQFSDMENTIPF